MSKPQLIIQQAAQIEYEVKKSRFISAIMPCSTEQQALQQLRTLASENPTANHLAFAWRIRQVDGMINERCHDAGEPSGTAGRPILNPLEGNGLINTVVGVIRYFGGVKLGTGGLTRAYGNAAKMAIEAATLVPWVEMTQLSLTIDYAELQSLQYQLKKSNGEIVQQQFNEQVDVVISLPAKEKDQIEQQFSGY